MPRPVLPASSARAPWADAHNHLGSACASPGKWLFTAEGQWAWGGGMCTEGLEAGCSDHKPGVASSRGALELCSRVPPGSGLALQEGGPVVLVLG